MWLYPLPSLIALVGWAYIYVSSGRTPILFSIVVIAAGGSPSSRGRAPSGVAVRPARHRRAEPPNMARCCSGP